MGPDRLRAKHMNENGPRNPLMIHTSHHQHNMIWRRWRHMLAGAMLFGISLLLIVQRKDQCEYNNNERRLEKQRGERFDALLSHAGVPGFADVAFQSRTTHLQQVHAPILLRYCTDIDRISAGKSGRRYCLKLCRYCPNF